MKKKAAKQKPDDIHRLISDTESKLGRVVNTPAGFYALRSAIFDEAHEIVSVSTLMRMWSYVATDVKPRTSTLDVLAHYLGHACYADYIHSDRTDGILSSDIILSHGFVVDEQLDCGDRLRLSWLPDRICDVAYLGSNAFRIVAAEKTHLHVGDTFNCAMIIENEPLYLSHLCHDDLPPRAYVCGLHGGVRLELLPPETEKV